MNNREITEAILSIRPKAEFSLVGDNLEGLTWLDTNQTKPSNDEIIASINNLPIIEAQQTAARQALLDKLGITDEEAKLLLGGN